MEALKSVLSGSKNTLLVCHDFPDPDCLGAALGMQFLLKAWKVPSVIAYGGFVGRPENRAMVQQLQIQALPLAGLDYSDFDRTVLVDTQPGARNHSLPPEARMDAAIDHHAKQLTSDDLPFCDIRQDLGSTCTMVTEYLRKAKVELNYRLATALYYGLKSDTQDLARESSAVDREVYHYLFSRVDHRLLSQIENPALEREFFSNVAKGYRSLEIRGNLGWCYLAKITRPDLVAQIADLFVRINEVQWMLCLGYLKGVLYFSIRAKNLKSEAGDVARKLVINENGSAGGHGQIAAGQVRCSERPDGLLLRIQKRFEELLAPRSRLPRRHPLSPPTTGD
jgi:nanoRNase/pAp phosphatase (c-di-AMP/oligoRNAs hydrolase)